MKYRSWSYLGFMFTIRGSVYGEIWVWSLFYALIGAFVYVINEFVEEIKVSKDAHTLFIIPVAFLLAFRSNTAYARFWEGRGHFGTFNFGIRECCRRAHTYIRGHSEGARLARRNIMRLLMVMAISVRENLRKRSLGNDALEANLNQCAAYLTPVEFEEYKNVVKNRPLLVMSWIGKFVHQAYIDKYIQDPTGQVLMSFDANVSALLTGWMGMNKVCYQPVPFPYVHTLHWFLMVWLSTLPLVLVDKLGLYIIPVMGLVSGALMAIEEVSEEIEDPFGDDLNDLPTENFEIGLIRDAGMVVNEHTGPMSMRCKAEIGLEQVGDFVPIVDYTPVGGSALQNQLENDPLLTQSQDRQLSDVVIEKVQENPVQHKADETPKLEMGELSKGTKSSFTEQQTSRPSKRAPSNKGAKSHDGSATARPAQDPISPTRSKSRKSRRDGSPTRAGAGKAIA